MLSPASISRSPTFCTFLALSSLNSLLFVLPLLLPPSLLVFLPLVWLPYVAPGDRVAHFAMQESPVPLVAEQPVSSVRVQPVCGASGPSAADKHQLHQLVASR